MADQHTNEQDTIRVKPRPQYKDGAKLNWTKKATHEFIKLYKTYPQLWNKNCVLYENKEVREAALRAMQQKTKCKSVREVKTKIITLKNQYNRLKRKILKLESKGIPCKVSLYWFDDFKEIMDADKLERDKRRQGYINTRSDFVRVYKSYPQLWNTNSDLYHDKQVRLAALRSIQEKMELESIRDVRRRIKNVRSDYHRTHKKILESESKGMPYRIKMDWFYDFKEIIDAERFEREKQNPDRDDTDSDQTDIEFPEQKSSTSFDNNSDKGYITPRCKFVKLYKSYPQLWNTNSDLYHDKKVRQAALRSIQKKMQLESIRDVQKRIKNLRSDYHRSKKKKFESERKGIPYKVKMDWFYHFKEIMDAERLQPENQNIDRDDTDSNQIEIEFPEQTSSTSFDNNSDKVSVYNDYNVLTTVECHKLKVDDPPSSCNEPGIKGERRPSITENVLFLTDSDDTDSDQTDTDLSEQKSSTSFDDHCAKVSAANDYSVLTPNSEAKWHRLDVDDAPSSSNEPSINEDDSASWSKEQTLELIKLYKTYPQLWNKNSDLYQNKEARNGALQSIQKKIQRTSIIEVLDKINSLKSAYYRTRKFISRMESKGVPYTPSFATLDWFYEFQEIMDSERLEPIKQELNDDAETDQFAIEFSDQKSSTSCDNNSVFIKSEPGDDNFERSPLVPVAKEDNVPTSAKMYRLEVDDTSGSSCRPSINEIENDEFQMFANNIAEQLRKLPLDKALQMQLKIQEMVAEERTKQNHK